ncbi:MAG: ATP-binding cassette domain-containing protein, partial [Rhodobacteraceae bacterium]|nr:ATP-binding cassette domain-containing protein [Paracoccaceae bacterium]
MMQQEKPQNKVISVENLSIGFRGRAGAMLPVLRNINLAVSAGESIGLVGESGSGKSTILKSVAGLLPPAGGNIAVTGGEALAPVVENRPPDHLRRIQLIFQNPDDSLNPRQTIAEILEQPLRLYFGLT